MPQDNIDTGIEQRTPVNFWRDGPNNKSTERLSPISQADTESAVTSPQNPPSPPPDKEGFAVKAAAPKDGNEWVDFMLEQLQALAVGSDRWLELSNELFTYCLLQPDVFDHKTALYPLKIPAPNAPPLGNQHPHLTAAAICWLIATKSDEQAPYKTLLYLSINLSSRALSQLICANLANIIKYQQQLNMQGKKLPQRTQLRLLEACIANKTHCDVTKLAPDLFPTKKELFKELLFLIRDDRSTQPKLDFPAARKWMLQNFLRYQPEMVYTARRAFTETDKHRKSDLEIFEHRILDAIVGTNIRVDFTKATPLLYQYAQENEKELCSPWLIETLSAHHRILLLDIQARRGQMESNELLAHFKQDPDEPAMRLAASYFTKISQIRTARTLPAQHINWRDVFNKGLKDQGTFGYFSLAIFTLEFAKFIAASNMPQPNKDSYIVQCYLNIQKHLLNALQKQGQDEGLFKKLTFNKKIKFFNIQNRIPSHFYQKLDIEVPATAKKNSNIDSARDLVVYFLYHAAYTHGILAVDAVKATANEILGQSAIDAHDEAKPGQRVTCPS